MPDPDTSKIDRGALAAAVACFVTWGLYPLLFQAVGRAGAGSWEAVAWRIVAGALTAGLFVLSTGQLRAAAAVARNPRTLVALAASGLLIGVNWGIYVWATQNEHTLAASLGYYVNPLLNMAVGAVMFREPLRRSALVAIGLAAVGVAVQALALGEGPWLALSLAVTFCLYGVIRKRVPVEPQTGLFVETLLLVAPAAALLVLLGADGSGAFGSSAEASLLLLSLGPLTVLPLTAFSLAARRMPLSVLGFLQFIQPTILFVLGVSQGEPVTPLRLASFALIWLGVAVFVGGMWRASSPAAQGRGA